MTDAEKLEKAKSILSEWIDAQGHDRCWYYPEVFNKLIELFGVTSTRVPSLPPRAEFERGCKRYQDEEFGKM